MAAHTPIDWAYPFPIKAAVADGIAADNYYRALAKVKDGFYPLSADGHWHGGIYFDEGSAEILDQSGVHCIADGEVIAYRIDQRYPSVRYDDEHLPFSTGFVLVRHRLALPTVRNASPATLTFYSLYMHLLDWAGYSGAAAPTPPAFLGEALYRVKPEQAHDGVLGLRVRAQPNGTVIALLPKGSKVSVGERDASAPKWRKLLRILEGSAIPDLSNQEPSGKPLGWVYTGEMQAVPGEPDTFLVAEDANDAAPGLAPQRGLYLRETANSGSPITGLLPPGATFSLQAGIGAYRELQRIAEGQAIAPLTVDSLQNVRGFVHFASLATSNALPRIDTVHVLPQPYPLKAGELVGHIGQYQNVDDPQPRALLHLEVFTCEDVPAFLAQSRAVAEQLAAEQETLIKVNRGARIIQPSIADAQIRADLDLRLSSDSPNEGRWASVQPYAVLKVAKSTLGRYRPTTKSYSLGAAQKQALATRLGVGVDEMPEQVDFLLQSYASQDGEPLPYLNNAPIPASHPLRKIGIALKPPRWVERSALNGQGQRNVSGAIAAWTTFPLEPAADAPLCGYERILPSAVWHDLAPQHKAIGPDNIRWWYLTVGGQEGQDISGWVAETAPLISKHSPWQWPGFNTLSPLDAQRAIDLGARDNQLTPAELRVALGKPWLAQQLSQLISQHESAWLWRDLDRLAAPESAGPKPDGAMQQKRREALSWWQQLAGQPAIAADGLAWHFHAIGLINLFKKTSRTLIWLRRVRELYGATLAERFKDKVIAVGEKLGIEPNHIMACIALETGRTFNPAIKNPRSSATGLIQFMDSTAKALGTTTEQLARMGHIEQMDYVEKYFLMTARNIGVPTSAWSLGDLYFAIFTPSVIKKSPADPVYVKGQRAYAVNMFHDRNKDGVITKQEIAENIHDYFNAGVAYEE